MSIFHQQNTGKEHKRKTADQAAENVAGKEHKRKTADQAAENVAKFKYLEMTLKTQDGKCE
jgi:maltodextrin utilization protein YvdJ